MPTDDGTGSSGTNISTGAPSDAGSRHDIILHQAIPELLINWDPHDATTDSPALNGFVILENEVRPTSKTPDF